MNKLKHFLCIMLLTSFDSQEALANSLNQDDMAFAFGNNSAVFSYSDLGDIAPLSHQEMIVRNPVDREHSFWLNVNTNSGSS